jgi:hypothetical protein
MKKGIIVIDGEPGSAELTAVWVQRTLREYDIRRFECERDFRCYLHMLDTRGEKTIPSLVICDTRIRWCYPEPNMNLSGAPVEVRERDVRMAGQRCWKMFREPAWRRNIPWIFYTLADKTEMNFCQFSDQYTTHVEKTGSIRPLLTEVVRLLQAVPA